MRIARSCWTTVAEVQIVACPDRNRRGKSEREDVAQKRGVSIAEYFADEWKEGAERLEVKLMRSSRREVVVTVISPNQPGSAQSTQD
jgi:hypothetical protein